MESTPAASLSHTARTLRTALERLPIRREGDLTLILARREAFRLLPGARSRQGPVLALLGAALLCLLIPLHRAYGAEGRVPYFLVYGILVQAGLVVLCARAVWAGLRADAASGSLDELLLTGARGREM